MNDFWLCFVPLLIAVMMVRRGIESFVATAG